MFRIIKKLLCDQGGWQMAIPAAMSLVSGIMGMVNKGKEAKKFNKSGEEKSLENFTTNWLNQYRGKAEGLKDQMLNNYITPGLNSAVQGGMFGAMQDAFNPNPTTTELQGVAGQARQQRNQALNRGVAGGQLRSQMLNIDQNEARNKLGLMENARQQAAQRGFQALQGMLPTQASDIARQQGLLNYDQLANTNWNNLAQLGVQRNLAQAGAASKSGQQSGGALGGGLMGLFDMFGGKGSPGTVTGFGSAPAGVAGPSMENGGFYSNILGALGGLFGGGGSGGSA